MIRKYSVAMIATSIIGVTAVLAGAASVANAANSHVAITVTGSTWSGNAINQWVADVAPTGLKVTYTPAGSAQGRQDFASYNNDFGVSDIGYQGNDPKTGAADSSSRPYAYLPIVAGGTAFPYNVQVGGQKVTNLRLSGKTLAEIFTNNITNWDDPAVTADNNGHALPSIPIIPVVHSEGAGSTAQFTRYLATEFPSLWNPFNGSAGLTEYFPTQGAQVAQSGSDGVMNYVSAASGNGTIGYDEYSYALSANFPVAKIQNTAGYFTLPTQYNDAVALTQAQINMDPTSADYLLQNLDDVYTNSDPRTYPISSYSYAIIPTSPTDTRMTTATRQTIADFLFYSICDGQGEVGPIGYSSLPLNLVEAGFSQVGKLGTADPNVDITNQNPANCNNPTFDKTNPTKNLLAEIAPQPLACDQQGQGPCGAGVVVAPPSTGSSSGAGGTAPASAAPGSVAIVKNPSAGVTKPGIGVGVGSPGKSTTRGGTSGPAKTVTSPNAITGSNQKAVNLGGVSVTPKQKTVIRVNPDTGQQETVAVDAATGTGPDAPTGASTDQASNLAATPTDLQAYERTSSNVVPAAIAIALLLVVLILPPLLSRRLASKKSPVS